MFLKIGNTIPGEYATKIERKMREGKKGIMNSINIYKLLFIILAAVK